MVSEHTVDTVVNGAEMAAELIAGEHLPAHRQRLGEQVLEDRIGLGQLGEGLVFGWMPGVTAGLLQPGFEAGIGGAHGGQVRLLSQQQRQLPVQFLTQPGGSLDAAQGAGHGLALGAGQVQHTEDAQQQTDQRHREQRAIAEKQPAAQLHRPSCLRLR